MSTVPVRLSRRDEPELPATWPRHAPERFHVLAKPTGAICNLDCSYCFFLSKEALYPGDQFRMREAVLTRYLGQLVEAHQRADGMTIAWQGGEPTLMGLDFFRSATALTRELARPDQQIEFTIQTNGTRLDQEWCDFLREEGYLVGLSIDGPRAMHDAYRVDKQGRGTFERVMGAAALLRTHSVDFNVLTTVNAANGDHGLEVYRFLRDEVGAEFIQLIPIVERINDDGRTFLQQGEHVTDRSVTPEQWGAFLVAVFDEWVRHDVGRIFLPNFEAALAAWVGLPASMCVFAETCGDAVALEHNGDVYSCDHFVEPDFLLGNIAETHLVELLASPKQRAFGTAKRDSLPRYCRACDVRFACNGECPKNRFVRTPDGEYGLNYLCAGYKTFFHHIDAPMRLMADLIRRGRFADEVMAMLP